MGERPPSANVPIHVRLHWVDWLRVAAIAGVFVFHTLRPFNTDDWHVKNADTSAILNVLTTFFASFGLAVLFLLAGVGARFALRKRSWQIFLRERTARLIVPFVVGTLILSSLQAFIEATHKGTYAGSYLGYLPAWAGNVADALGRGLSPTVFGIGYHLWFLGFLFAISVLALPLCTWLMGERGDALIDGVARRLAWPGASLVFVLPIFLLMGIGATMGSSEHDWFEFAWYLGYYMIGFVLLGDDRFMAAVRRDRWLAAGVALVSTALILAGIPAPLDTAADQGFGMTFLVMGLLFAAEGWAWTLVVLNIGMRTARLQRPVSEHLGDAVLPVYVIHQPIILAVAFFVVQSPLGILPKWLVLFGISAVVTLALAELALRVPVARIVLGARARPAGAIARAPARVAAEPQRVAQSARPRYARPR